MGVVIGEGEGAVLWVFVPLVPIVSCWLPDYMVQFLELFAAAESKEAHCGCCNSVHLDYSASGSDNLGLSVDIYNRRKMRAVARVQQRNRLDYHCRRILRAVTVDCRLLLENCLLIKK